MSRTYRCRSLPVLPGTPHKLVDAHLEKRSGGVRREERLRGWGDTTFAVGFVLSHPWVHVLAAYSKKPHRVPGNRWVRRVAKVELTRWAEDFDDFDGHLPGKLDGWDEYQIW